MAGNGLAADADGSIYFITGNGTFAPHGKNLGSSFVSLKPIITRNNSGNISRVDINVVDWFTPYRRSWLSDFDLDLGSAGPVLIPNTRYLVGGGKQGIIYLVDRDNMGKLDVENASAWDTTYNSCIVPQHPPPSCPQENGKLYGDFYPEKWDADHVKQKFQTGYNHYTPNTEMKDWEHWPHIHGTPAYFDFNNGRSMMYVWPEKD